MGLAFFLSNSAFTCKMTGLSRSLMIEPQRLFCAFQLCAYCELWLSYRRKLFADVDGLYFFISLFHLLLSGLRPSSFRFLFFSRFSVCSLFYLDSVAMLLCLTAFLTYKNFQYVPSTVDRYLHSHEEVFMQVNRFHCCRVSRHRMVMLLRVL